MSDRETGAAGVAHKQFQFLQAASKIIFYAMIIFLGHFCFSGVTEKAASAGSRRFCRTLRIVCAIGLLGYACAVT